MRRWLSRKSGSWDGQSIELTSAFVFDVKSLGFATLIQQNLDLLFRFLQRRLARGSV